MARQEVSRTTHIEEGELRVTHENAILTNITLIIQRKRTKHEFHRKTQLNKYLLQINAFYAVAFQKQF